MEEDNIQMALGNKILKLMTENQVRIIIKEEISKAVKDIYKELDNLRVRINELELKDTKYKQKS